MRHIAAIICLLLALSTTGCAAWYKQFKENPVAVIDDFNAKTDIIVEGLQISYYEALKFLPPEQAADLREKWDKGMIVLNNSKKALRSGIDAAVAVQGELDLARLFGDVVEAVRFIENIINVFKAHPSVAAKFGSPQKDPFVTAYYERYGTHK